MSAEAVALLEELRTTALSCTACRLAEERLNVVFGDGNPRADVVFVGEAPGAREDEEGLPFVGPSGKLLERLLAEIGLRREDVYIANVVKCRPPKNRDPRPDEIVACKGYLREQLSLIDPKVVVTLGNFSSKLLLNTETGITRLRGTAYEWWGRYLVPTFHPAAALRGSAQVLEDMQYDFGLVAAAIAGNLRANADNVGANADNVGANTDHDEVEPAAEPDDDPEQLGLFGA
ncbi:MAG: uracil-DNA glycosylase [Acidimicrobiia bacterium]|jgi:DNA polymerase